MALQNHPIVHGAYGNPAYLPDIYRHCYEYTEPVYEGEGSDPPAVQRVFWLDYSGTIANATTLLVSIGWNGSGIPEADLTIAILIVGALIGATTIMRSRCRLWSCTGLGLCGDIDQTYHGLAFRANTPASSLR